ncbi:MAG: efflux RND transporter periplasmic adaptor subunit [Pseudomonadota bacterium]
MAVILAFSLGSCGNKEDETIETEVVRPVKLLTVGAFEVGGRLVLPGKTRAAQGVELAFQVGGTLVDLPVQEGQNVAAGELLARLDPRDADAALQNAQGQLQRARAMKRLANVEYNRLYRVQKADPGAVAQSLVDRALERKYMAEANIYSLEASVRAAKLQRSYHDLKAPFAGVVTRRYVDNFQEVQAKKAIFALDDLSRVEILVDVPESVMAPVRAPGGYRLFAEFASAPGKRYSVTVKERALRADPATLTYQVTFVMPQPKEIRVLPGMTANLVAKPREGANVPSPIVVPATAIFSREAGSSSVWVVEKDPSTVHLRKVVTGGLVESSSIRIVEGLKDGETIAVSGVSRLREGMRVRALEQ